MRHFGLALLVVLLPNAPRLDAQPAPSFEVASVKPNNSGLLGATGFRTEPGRLTVTNLPLATLILRAFGVQEYQVFGGPNWLKLDRYDIAAKAESNADAESMMVMLRSLLADRFRLAVHRETRELPAYFMVVAKSGSKLREAKAGEELRMTENPRNEPGRGMVMHRIGQNVPMQQLAAYLSGPLRRPVLDATGLAGSYDFDVEWMPDPGAGPGADGFYDPLLTALEVQLGLKLESRKGPVEILVIDRAEKPTDN